MELRLGEGRETNVLTEPEWRAVGATVRSTFRETDSASRLSDGRLAVLMPMTNQRHALMASARLVDRLRKVPGLPEDLSCQAGISGWTFEGASAPELFEQASTALVGARIAGARGAFVFV
jgi:GGDEF domain-containing protein